MTAVSLRVGEELMGRERKGIGSILDSRMEKRGSLRRTFSADMSSKKWLAQNNMSSTVSSIDTASSSSSTSDDDDDDELEKEKENKGVERSTPFHSWSSIELEKTDRNSPIFTAPYVHPLVRRSSSSLSERSLQICTESLGSETGSDGFSNDHKDYLIHSSSEEENNEEVVSNEMGMIKRKGLVAVNYNCCISRRSPTCSFPPPLSSMSGRDGLHLQMRPHRRDGRLVVEAVPVSPHYYLHAHREGGRLQLSFIKSPSTEQVPHIPPQEEKTEIVSKVEVVEGEEEEEEEDVVERRTHVLEVKAFQEEVMRVGHPTLVVMNKLMCSMHAMRRLNNPNPWRSKKLDGQDEQQQEKEIMSSSKILTNGYDRWWKMGPMTHPSAQEYPPNKLMVLKKKPAVVIKGEAGLLPLMRRCNIEPLPLRPVTVWEPMCIATT